MTLINTFTGIAMGTINADNTVTTCFGDTYEVSKGDLEWLKERQNNRGFDSRDIKAVGYLVD